MGRRSIQAGAQFLRGLFGLTASGDEPPRIQDLNSLYLLFSSQLKYIFQSGIAEYIETEEYYIGSLCQIAGVIYVSQSGAGSSPNVNNPPATDDGTNWLDLLDADGLLAKLLTVDGSGSGLDADKVRATTPGAGGLALLALSALGTNWASALGAALATNVKHVMGAGLGADWQALLEAAANTAVKSNIAASCSGNAATATTAASCSGNAATASSAAACSGIGNFSYLAGGTLPSGGTFLVLRVISSGEVGVFTYAGGTSLPGSVSGNGYAYAYFRMTN
jgi:hypothetical protein